MTDYFLPYCDARGQLAGVKSVIEMYLKALENGYELQQEVCLKMLAEEVSEIEKLLEKTV